MNLVGLKDAEQLSNVSSTTIRNYVKQGRLKGYQQSNRLLVSREELLSVFAPKLRSSSSVSAGAPGTRVARVIAVANQKGGVGKTTSAVAISTLLARDFSVLALDCDPQGNMTQAFGFDPDALDKTVYNALLEEIPLGDTFLQIGPPPPDLYLAPSNLDLADIWRRAAGKVGLETLLKSALLPFVSRFQYIIIDCPPSLDLTTLNCLVAATEVIVPVDMSLFSVRGMVKLNATMQEVRKVNPDLPLPKILACRTEHTTISKTIQTGLRDKFGGGIFAATIPKTKDVEASHFARRPLPLFAPSSKATDAYASVVEEIKRG